MLLRFQNTLAEIKSAMKSKRLIEMKRIQAPIKALDIQSADDVTLRVYLCGNGPNKWLLTPGLGTPLICWKYLIERFKDEMTIAIWDPRGCYQSTKPNDPNRFHIAEHVRDAKAIIEALGWQKESFVTGGWSMGVQIALSLYESMPKNIKALVLVNGTFEHILATAMGIPKADAILSGAFRGMAKAAPVFAPLAKYLLSQDWTVSVIKSMKLVATNDDFFELAVREFKDLDFAAYFSMMTQINEESAAHVLARVDVPTLITAGTADKMTPMKVSEKMHKQINGSSLFVIPGGTHYATLEYPEIVNLKIEDFFRREVFGKTWGK